jgi:capsular exopolysaccharide synthesis family protein
MNLGEAGSSERSLLHLRDYGRVLSERRAIVLTCLVLVVLFTTTFTFLATPLYRATTTIQVERQGPGVLAFSDMAAMDYYDYQDFYQTQYKILGSQTVLRLAAERLDLPNRPEYATRTGSPIRRWITALRSSVSGDSADLEPQDPMVVAAKFIDGGLSIEPVRNSKLVKITFIDRSRELSADVANAVAEAYEQFNTDARFTTTKQAGEFLTKQVARLQGDIQTQERTLQKYAAQNEILALSAGSQDISEKALSDINTKYVEAKGRLAVAQARYDAVSRGSADSLPEVLTSPLILELKKQYAEVERRHSQMAERFKPDWPPLQQLQEELDGAKNRLATETDAIARQVRSVAKADYAKTQAEVENFSGQVNSQKGEVQRVGRDAIQYASLKAEIETKRKMLNDLLTRQNETETTRGLTRATNIRVVDRAEAPRGPFKPNKKLNLALSLIFGLGLGGATAFLFNYLDNTVKSEHDIQRYAGVPALGFVPLYQPLHAVEGDGTAEPPQRSQYEADLACHADSRSSFAEAFKSLRTSFLLASPERPPRHVVVTSCEPLDGKSTVATNLAIALTQIGRRVVMVDADLRRPRLHKVLGLSNEIGVSSFLSGNAPAEDLIQDTTIPNLFAITSGPVPPNPSELLASAALEALLKSLEELGPFDHVFVDSPPLLQMADAVLLADRMEATIIVAREGRTVNAALASGVRRLRQSRARILGAVLNAVVEKFGGYYYYRYKYEPGDSNPAKLTRRLKIIGGARRSRRQA